MYKLGPATVMLPPSFGVSPAVVLGAAVIGEAVLGIAVPGAAVFGAAVLDAAVLDAAVLDGATCVVAVALLTGEVPLSSSEPHPAATDASTTIAPMARVNV
jgi:hypothetical protein